MPNVHEPPKYSELSEAKVGATLHFEEALSPAADPVSAVPSLVFTPASVDAEVEVTVVDPELHAAHPTTSAPPVNVANSERRSITALHPPACRGPSALD